MIDFALFIDCFIGSFLGAFVAVWLDRKRQPKPPREHPMTDFTP
jgi:hypothetical protein